MKWLKPVVFLGALVPLVYYTWALFNDLLGANPVEVITREAGEWALRFLWLTLLMTPLRRWGSWAWPLRLRRMLGLYAFFYATVHLLLYLWLDKFFIGSEILADIIKRPFITVGMLAWLLLLPLALTSNQFMIRKLGKRWRQLHRSVYLIAGLAILHFFWLVKADLLQPLIYLGLLAVLMWTRLPQLFPHLTTKSPKSAG